MPSLALGTGAGAAEGLETLLARHRAEEVLRQAQERLTEEQRAHQATESYQNRALDMQAQLRKDALAEKASTDIEKQLSTLPVNSTVSQPTQQKFVGAGVSPELFTAQPGKPVSSTMGYLPLSAVGAGQSSMHPDTTTTTTPASTPTPSDQQQQQQQQGQPPAPPPARSTMIRTEDPTSPLSTPTTYTYKGTEAQQLARTKEKDTAQKEADAVAHQAELLQQAAQKLEMQGKVNEANILRAHAEAELATVRAQHIGDIKPLPPQIVDQMASLNTAEVEGVKVLKTLKEQGLDKVNDPLDPRWQKFLVTQFKIAPSDYAKADVQQRVAMVNAVLTRSLMGARPSQYVAQLIQTHLPQGEMAGAQMAHVVNNVLQQAGERRNEVEGLSGRELNSLKPVSGQTYSQFLQGGVGPAGNRPPDLIFDPATGTFRKP